MLQYRVHAHVTVFYLNGVLHYVKVKLRYGMTCLVDLCTMNEFNRTEPLLHKLTLIWTLASVHEGSQQYSYGSIPGTDRCFPLVQRVQTGSASQPAPTRRVPNISQTPPEREASHPHSTRLKLIENWRCSLTPIHFTTSG